MRFGTRTTITTLPVNCQDMFMLQHVHRSKLLPVQ